MRRLFWVSVGAGLGISGYRRANRVVREITGQRRPPQRQFRLRLSHLRGVTGFVRDVREGMDLYEEQRRPSLEPRRDPPPPALGWQTAGSASGAPRAGAGHNGASTH